MSRDERLSVSEEQGHIKALREPWAHPYRPEILKRNRSLIAYFCWYALVVCGASGVFRMVIGSWALAVPFFVSFAAYAAFAILDDRIVRALKGNSIVTLYLLQVPAWAMAVLLGSVLDPSNATVTFLIFVISLPLFILDVPARVMGATTLWIALYLLCAWATKPTDVLVKDMSYLVMACIASYTLTWLLLRERLSDVRLSVDSEVEARTDKLTGLKNRYALSQELGRYEGRELIVALTRIDDLSFYNDMFGHEVGDGILGIYSQVLTRSFGRRRVYRYTERELLLMVADMGAEEFEATMRGCIDELGRLAGEAYNVSPGSSVGYVHGVARDEEDHRLMISHADARLAQAQHAGRLQIRGAAYDPDIMHVEELAAIIGGNLKSTAVDQLTGLPTMRAFETRARNIIDSVSPKDQVVAFIYFDLENFKSFNEEHGFQEGDDLLREVAKILRDAFPRRLVSRFADDRFVVMSYENEYESGIAQALNKTFDLHGRTGMPLKAGVYLYRDRSEDIGVACDRAHRACRSVKGRYDQYWRLYDEELRLEDERRAYIISHIDEAVANDWLCVYYQPIVRAQTNEVVECEALVRWNDPVYGFLPPFAFIGELERAHLVHKADFWVAEHVCRDYRARVDAGLAPLPVSINLSRLDFMLCDVEEELLRLTAQYGVPHGHLHVEVTESALSEDFAQLAAVTNRLRSQGFEIWLDDFGSDYSSLTTLKDFPCDVIKLDLMFLRSFHSNERSRVIIQQVVEMSQRLGARCLSEGVEEQEHLDFLREIGCTYAQGYLISKPQPMPELMEQGLLPA